MVFGPEYTFTGGSHASPPTSAFRRENAGLQIVILLPERGMSALEKSEELSRLPRRYCVVPHRLEGELRHLAHVWTPAFRDLN